MATTTIPGLQTFSTAYPFDVSIQNQLNGEDLAIMYIVDTVSSGSAAQQITLQIMQVDTASSYTIRGYDFAAPTTPIASPSSPIATVAPLGSPFTPCPEQYNLSVSFRPGTLRAEVLNQFTSLLQTALASALPGNPVAVYGPEVHPTGVQTWYCAFSNDISTGLPGSAPWSLSITLNGVSAMAGAGTRATQVAFKFTNVFIGDVGNAMMFSRLKHLDIINHLGHSYAPVFFAVDGNDTLSLETDTNEMGIYFQTVGRQPIQFGPNTEIVFSFPYELSGVAAGQTMFFNTQGEVSAYTLTPQSSQDFAPVTDSTSYPGLVTITAPFGPVGSPVPNPAYLALEVQLKTQNSVITVTEPFLATLAPPFAPLSPMPPYVATCIQNLSDTTPAATGNLLLLISDILNKNSGNGLIDLSTPFVLANWITAYTDAASWFSAPSSGLDPTVVASGPAGNPLGTCGIAANWSSGLVNYVTNKYTTLTQLLVNDKATYVSGTSIYIIASQSLFDFYAGNYVASIAIPPAYLLETTGFSSTAWLPAIIAAAAFQTAAGKTVTVYSSAAGVSSMYSQTSPWSNVSFVQYVTSNFSKLCTTLPFGVVYAFNGLNYVVASQALYDYLWASYQVSLLQTVVTRTPQTVDMYPDIASYIFNFSNIVVSGSDGCVMLGISIRNLPGYWDTNFQVPVIKEQSTLNAQLELGPATVNGHFRLGSRVDFLTGSTNAAGLANISIEEFWGLNLLGMPAVPSPGVNSTVAGQPGFPGQPVKVQNADMVVVGGRLAVNSLASGAAGLDFNSHPVYPTGIPGDTNTNEHLYVGGDSYIAGNLVTTGATTIGTSLRVDGNPSVITLSLGGNGAFNIDAPYIVGGRFTVGNNGFVGIGVCQPGCPLEVEAFKPLSPVSSTATVIQSTVSIYSHGTVVAPNVSTTSDERIKTDIVASDPAQDLALLEQLQVVDYRHKDVATHGTEIQKGFIAQDVEKWFPGSVMKHTAFAPDLYDVPAEATLNGSVLRVMMNQAHRLADGDRVRLITNGQVNRDVSVIVIDADIFMVQDWEWPTEALFVFGKQVDDLRVLNYQHLFTSGVGAIQELSRRTLLLETQAKEQQLRLDEMNTLVHKLQDQRIAREETKRVSFMTRLVRSLNF